MSVRPIDLSQQPPVPRADPGPEPRLDWLPVEALVIDDDYQRPLGDKNWRRIRAIAARFDWARFTAISAAPRDDGTFAVIDGQHRVHAAALAGQAMVPALIVPVPVEAQAAAFASINSDRTAVSLFHLLRAGLAAGDAWAVRCDAAVSAAGCRLRTSVVSALQRKPRDVYTLGLVRDMVRLNRDAVVTRGLRAIVASDAGDDVRAYVMAVLRPWFGVLAASAVPDDLDLAGFASRRDLVRLCLVISHLRAEPGRQRDSAYQLAMLAIRRALAEDGYLPDLPVADRPRVAETPRVQPSPTPSPVPVPMAAPAGGVAKLREVDGVRLPRIRVGVRR